MSNLEVKSQPKADSMVRTTILHVASAKPVSGGR